MKNSLLEEKKNKKIKYFKSTSHFGFQLVSDTYLLIRCCFFWGREGERDLFEQKNCVPMLTVILFSFECEMQTQQKPKKTDISSDTNNRILDLFIGPFYNPSFLRFAVLGFFLWISGCLSNFLSVFFCKNLGICCLVWHLKLKFLTVVNSL